MSEFKKLYVTFEAVSVNRDTNQIMPGSGYMALEFNRPLDGIEAIQELQTAVREELLRDMKQEFQNVKIHYWQRME